MVRFIIIALLAFTLISNLSLIVTAQICGQSLGTCVTLGPSGCIRRCQGCGYDWGNC
ncbi:unnamed protein product, partial [Rotaria sp. Silwood2]